MSRIAQVFSDAKEKRRKLLITYVCAGDPDLETTAKLVPQLVASGADIIELGVPFSDPLADGPTIQAASQRALRKGVTLKKVLELVVKLRAEGVAAPLVLMGYLNPIIAFGVSPFCKEAAAAGVDGLIVPDLPLDEAAPLETQSATHGIDLILLAAPTTPAERVISIARRTKGFLYFVSMTGVTGSKTALPEDLPERLRAAREASSQPVAVGFGISTADQARALALHADAVVVGSAIVERLRQSPDDFEPVLSLVRELSQALRGAPSLHHGIKNFML